MQDMALKQLRDLIGKNKYINKDVYEYIYSNQKDLSRKYVSLLSPDSKLYSSALAPFFSFELENPAKDVLKLFELISLRDGVLPLLNFFHSTPTPEKADPILVVDCALSSLVPREWRSKTVLRELVCLKKDASLANSKVIIVISPEKNSTPLNIVRNEIRKIKNKINASCEILLFFSSVNRVGVENIQIEDSWRYKLFQSILVELADCRVRVLDWKEYSSEDLSSSRCFFINPLLYYFTDSYLYHDLLQRGSTPLLNDGNANGDSRYLLQLSANHGFALHQDFVSEYSEDKMMLNYISANKKLAKLEKNDFGSIALAGEEFCEKATDVAVDLYTNRQTLL